MIAHRLTTIQNAENILVLTEEGIAESGTHEELLKKGGIYEKLYHTATTRISKTENREVLMWKRRERFGKGTTNFTYTLMRDYMNDIVQKVVFNQSAIIFIHVCFDKSIRNELIQPDKYEMSDMKMEPSDSVNESISRFDRWQMDRTQHSERDRLRAYASIKHMIWMLGQDVGLDFYRLLQFHLGLYHAS